MDHEPSRTVVVSGAGGGGSGAAIARRLAERGHVVFANGLPEHVAALEELQSAGRSLRGSILPAVFDVSSEAEVVSFFEKQQLAKDATIIIHNAAPSLPPAPIETLSAGAWRQEFAVSADGAFHLLRAAVPAMKRHHWGRVVFISTNAVFRGARGRSAAYPAAKAALHGLMVQAGMELGEYGVTANIIAPSQIDTPRARRGGRRDDASMSAYAADIPLGRVSTPSDIAEAVAFLTSDAASYITGETLRMDGGARFAAKSTGTMR